VSTSTERHVRNYMRKTRSKISASGNTGKVVMKVYRGVGGIAPLSLTSVPDGENGQLHAPLEMLTTINYF
jgi:hypothetical protein